MVTKEIKTGPEEVEETLRNTMKTVQRKLEDGKLKVRILDLLVDAKVLLDKEIKESSERRR